MNRVMEVQLRYVITERPPCAVVSLSGVLTKATAESLEDCQILLLQKDLKWVIFCCKDLEKIEVSGPPALVRLQKGLRDQGRQIRVCCLKKDQKQLLFDAGAIRRNEVSPDLPSALESVSQAARSP